MTNYNNFIQDFPKRCCEILDKYEADALSGGREVTLTLAMAASGFVVPYERLRPRPQEGEPPYPDRGIYEQAASQLDSLLKEKFLGSCLWKEEVSSWSFGNLKSVADEGPDAWPELQERKPLGPNKEVGSTLTHLRNALAHGNIFTLPKDGPDKDNPDIELIIFLSKPSMKSRKFNFLCVSPQDFQKFLKKWFVFISELEIPTAVFSSAVS